MNYGHVGAAPRGTYAYGGTSGMPAPMPAATPAPMYAQHAGMAALGGAYPGGAAGGMPGAMPSAQGPNQYAHAGLGAYTGGGATAGASSAGGAYSSAAGAYGGAAGTYGGAGGAYGGAASASTTAPPGGATAGGFSKSPLFQPAQFQFFAGAGGGVGQAPQLSGAGMYGAPGAGGPPAAESHGIFGPVQGLGSHPPPGQSMPGMYGGPSPSGANYGAPQGAAAAGPSGFADPYGRPPDRNAYGQSLPDPNPYGQPPQADVGRGGGPMMGYGQTPPPQSDSGSGNYKIGDPIEVWSKSLGVWCRGQVEGIDGPMVNVKFMAPNGSFFSKGVPDGHEQLRHLASSEAANSPDRGHGQHGGQGGHGGHRQHGAQGAYGGHGRHGYAPDQPMQRQRAPVRVDAEEDIVDVSSGQKVVGALSREALHGTDASLRGTISLNVHAQDDESMHQQVPQNRDASMIANVVVEQAMLMSRYVAKEPRDCFDKDWPGPNGQDPLLCLYQNGSHAAVADAIVRLSREVAQICAHQNSVVEASLPAKIFGDIHGQFRDMLLMLHHFHFPQMEGPTQFIFNGDWADRGQHQLEVVSLVFALKALLPNKVWLVRGNHEDAVQNRSMGSAGFEAHVMQRLGNSVGPRVFAAIHETFNLLPLGCLVGQKILSVHGGIGEGSWSLNYLNNVRRPLDHDSIPADPVVYNVLWSDPIPDDPGQADTFGVHDSPRDGHQHMIVTFGKDITAQFCANNHIDMIVRSHQAITRGYGYDVMHGGKCVRVFSARDYEGQGNDGCVLHIADTPQGIIVRPQVLRSLACPKM